MQELKIGDTVKVIRESYCLPLNSEWVILHKYNADGFEYVKVHQEDNTYKNEGGWDQDRFELLKFPYSPSYGKPMESLTVTPEDINGRVSAIDKQVSGNHYKDCSIQPIEYIHANGLNFFEGNSIKYITRHRKKNGKADLLKAIHYLELMIELEYPDE